MPSLTVPLVVRKVADRFKSCAGVSYGSLCTLIHCTACGIETLADMVREAPWSPSESAISRSFNEFDSARVIKRMRSGLLCKLSAELNPERFCFAVDDTIVPRYGKFLFGIGNQRQHGKGGSMRGQRIMVLTLVDNERGVAYPLDFAMCFNVGAPGYIKGHDLCIKLVKGVIAEGFPPLFTTVDSWFDSIELFEKFDIEGLTLIAEARQNRCVRSSASSKEPWKKWKDMLHKQQKVGVKLPKSNRAKKSKKTKYIATRRVRIKGRSKQVIACAVYNKPFESAFFAVYISNNLALDGGDLWGYSRARWRIEETFRILKQSLSLLTYPSTSESTCIANIVAPFLILNELYLNPEAWFGTKLQSVGKILKNYQEHEFWKMLDEISRGTKRVTVIYLQKRRSQTENQKKPVNPTADDIRKYLSCA